MMPAATRRTLEETSGCRDGEDDIAFFKMMRPVTRLTEAETSGRYDVEDGINSRLYRWRNWSGENCSQFWVFKYRLRYCVCCVVIVIHLRKGEQFAADFCNNFGHILSSNIRRNRIPWVD